MTGTENFCFRIGSGVGLWCDGPAAAGFRKGENIMELGEGLKKILLVGIGTAAVTAEKSKEILDELVKKGELTVEQGKVLNQELKHNIKSTVKTAADSVKESAARKNDQEELKATISRLTPRLLRRKPRQQKNRPRKLYRKLLRKQKMQKIPGAKNRQQSNRLRIANIRLTKRQRRRSSKWRSLWAEKKRRKKRKADMESG